MVNDPQTDPECVGYLLKKDSSYGTSNIEVVNLGSALMVDGKIYISKAR